MYGPVDNIATRRLRDLNGGEVALLVPFVILIFVFGLFPTLFSKGLNLNPTANPPSIATTAAVATTPVTDAVTQEQP
jgi:NADH:ubiquinone oxidoreductase subunit 4 (subunit M)